MTQLYLFLHVFGDDMLEGGQFHIYFDDLLVWESQYFTGEVVLGRQLAIKESIEGHVNDDFLLPVLHRLLVFIITHPKFINPSTPYHHLWMYYTSSNLRASNSWYLFSTFNVPYDISLVYLSAICIIDFLFLFSFLLHPSKLELVYLIIFLNSSKSSLFSFIMSSFSIRSGSLSEGGKSSVDTLYFRFRFSVARPSPVRKVPSPSYLILVDVRCCVFLRYSICLAFCLVYLVYRITMSLLLEIKESSASGYSYLLLTGKPN